MFIRGIKGDVQQYKAHKIASVQLESMRCGDCFQLGKKMPKQLNWSNVDNGLLYFPFLDKIIWFLIELDPGFQGLLVPKYWSASEKQKFLCDKVY